MSSGERKRISPNHKGYGLYGVVGLQYMFKFEREWRGKANQRVWESRIGKDLNVSSILSRREPVKLPLNLPAPSGKAKYSWETDSEQVPWGKGEKYRE